MACMCVFFSQLAFRMVRAVRALVAAQDYPTAPLQTECVLQLVNCNCGIYTVFLPATCQDTSF